MTAVTAVPAARAGVVRELRWSLSDIGLMTRRYLLHYVRVPALVFFSAVQPIIFVLMFRYVFGGAIPIKGTSYVNFLMPGIIAQTAAFGSFGTAIGLAEDLGKGVIDRFRSLPMSRSAVLIGRLASDTVRNVFVVLLMIGVGYAVGFRFSNGVGPAVGLVALSILFGLGIMAISAAVGLGLKDTEAVQSFGLVWLFPVTFASSAFVPLQTLPGWLQAFAKVNPMTMTVDALRGMALGGPTALHLWQSLLSIALILAVFVPVSVRAYRKASL